MGLSLCLCQLGVILLQPGVVGRYCAGSLAGLGMQQQRADSSFLVQLLASEGDGVGRRRWKQEPACRDPQAGTWCCPWSSWASCIASLHTLSWRSPILNSKTKLFWWRWKKPLILELSKYSRGLCRFTFSFHFFWSVLSKESVKLIFTERTYLWFERSRRVQTLAGFHPAARSVFFHKAESL